MKDPNKSFGELTKEFWDAFHDEAIVFMNESQHKEFKKKLLPLMDSVNQRAFEQGQDAGWCDTNQSSPDPTF